jgi:hypothetical protein
MSVVEIFALGQQDFFIRCFTIAASSILPYTPDDPLFICTNGVVFR